MVFALSDFAVDFGLIVTFGGIGLIVNGLVVYIAVLVAGERAENRRGRGEGETPA